MKRIRYILYVITLLLAVGCVKTYVDQDMLRPDVSPQKIELSIAAPSTAVVGSRAEGGFNEMTIRRGYIFVFEADGTLLGSEKIVVENVVDNGTQYPEITTNISGYDGSTDKIIAVFNYCKNSAKSDFTGLTKDNISDYFPLDKNYLAQLQGDLVNGIYNLGMPMFVNDFDDTDDNSVHEVYRALARIELFVKESNVSTGHIDHTHSFTPDNVKFALLNSATDGEIGFASRGDVKGKIGGDIHQSSDVVEFDKKATLYNPNEDIQSVASSSNVIYIYEYPYSTKDIKGNNLTQGVYDPRRLSILIEHKDDVAHPGEAASYYKLQLVDKSVNKYYDIKRNHDYRVVIKSVYSDGYVDLEEAYMMPPSNIEYEIYDNQGELTFSNGQYAISMDQVLNYESVTIYGPYTTPLSFDNIRRILPKEVTESMDAAELAAMTNIVDFAVIDDSEVQVDVVKNEFSSDSKLTDVGRSIKLNLSGEGECSIKLKIKLGNLELGFDKITIQKIGGDFGGDSSFDAHPCQLTIENRNVVAGTWNSIDKDFGARNDGDNMIVYMGENATPVGYKSLNGYISSSAASNAYPYFEPKTREGYYSYYDVNDPDKTIKKSMIILNQLAPFYVGHFGSKATNGPHYYNGLIVEKIEEIEDDRDEHNVKETGGLMNWSEQSGMVYYDKYKIYGEYLGLKKYLNFSEGRDITEYIVQNNEMVDAMPVAARYCYMKNDIDGDGVIESDEPIVWYLPAANQMLAMWISKHLIDAQVGSEYYGFNLQYDSAPWYWTCSEVAQTPDELNNLVFNKNVARFNMLEGELSNIGLKGADNNDAFAHVRCVRGVKYDNTK